MHCPPVAWHQALCNCQQHPRPAPSPVPAVPAGLTGAALFQALSSRPVRRVRHSHIIFSPLATPLACRSARATRSLRWPGPCTWLAARASAPRRWPTPRAARWQRCPAWMADPGEPLHRSARGLLAPWRVPMLCVCEGRCCCARCRLGSGCAQADALHLDVLAGGFLQAVARQPLRPAARCRRLLQRVAPGPSPGWPPASI